MQQIKPPPRPWAKSKPTISASTITCRSSFSSQISIHSLWEPYYCTTVSMLIYIKKFLYYLTTLSSIPTYCLFTHIPTRIHTKTHQAIFVIQQCNKTPKILNIKYVSVLTPYALQLLNKLSSKLKVLESAIINITNMLVRYCSSVSFK